MSDEEELTYELKKAITRLELYGDWVYDCEKKRQKIFEEFMVELEKTLVSIQAKFRLSSLVRLWEDKPDKENVIVDPEEISELSNWHRSDTTY